MRSPISRRSASIWVSPGPPRKPKPPRWRSRWVQERTRRERWYSRWASSTCNVPSAVRARSPKMSRISPVRSITLQPQARSRLRCCTGDSAASTIATVTSCSLIAAPWALDLAFAQQGGGAAHRAAARSPDGRRRGRSRRPGRPPRPAGPRRRGPPPPASRAGRFSQGRMTAARVGAGLVAPGTAIGRAIVQPPAGAISRTASRNAAGAVRVALPSALAASNSWIGAPGITVLMACL